MDYDADGRTDIVTGSYTGQFYLFRRQADGGFAQRELLDDETGQTLLMPFDTAYSVTPELVDMDADGDLDLIVGNRSGPVLVVTNVGTRKAPVWSKTHTPLTTTDKGAIEGSNAHHADWDGDGLRDLIVGSESGEVRWYRNTGANDAPRYAAGALLVAAGNSSYEPEGSIPKGPGMRAKVHVTDWDDDGRVDLLVGDVTWQQSTSKPLTADEEKTKQGLEREYHEATQRREEAQDDQQREAATKAIAELRAKLKPLQRTELHTHGWVWLYRRTAASTRKSR